MNVAGRETPMTPAAPVGRDKCSVPGDSQRRQRRCAAYAGLRGLYFFLPLPLRERAEVRGRVARRRAAAFTLTPSLSHQGRGGRKSGGFTLIELMIVVVIAVILAAIAYPLYTHYVSKSRRTAAITALQHAAAQEEKYYALHNTYARSLTSIGYATKTVDVPSPQKKWYTLAVTAGTVSGYVLTAKPNNVQAKDKGCGTYTLKSDGERSVNGPEGAAKCWGSG